MKKEENWVTGSLQEEGRGQGYFIPIGRRKRTGLLDPYWEKEEDWVTGSL